MSRLQSVAKETLSNAVQSLTQNLDSPEFLQQIEEAVHLLKTTGNRIIVTGMGKSGLVARKTAATLTSTGSPSVFLHPADALHGDMGNVQTKEVVIAFSNSGETREIIELLPHIRFLGAKLIAITQKNKSTLAKEGDVAVIYSITKEGCPLNLAPMASTTVSLAIGDSLAAGLIELNKFQPKDFGKFHPSGALGKKLLTKVKDVMKDDITTFTVNKDAPFKEILATLVSSNMGAVLVVGSKGHMRGIITDGDIKRYLDTNEKTLQSLFSKTAQELMHEHPIWTSPETLIETAVSIMHEKKTYTLPVVNDHKKPVGIIRMHDTIEYI
ncbi:MAG: KpsF/GutQ family sugar-phosphate isomerase [Leptospirales bacterium]